MELIDRVSSKNAAVVLARWNRVFTFPEIWASDKDSHSIENTLSALAEDYHILHIPTIAYSSWPKDTVASLMRTVLGA